MIGSSYVFKLLKCVWKPWRGCLFITVPNFRHIQWHWEILNVRKN